MLYVMRLARLLLTGLRIPVLGWLGRVPVWVLLLAG